MVLSRFHVATRVGFACNTPRSRNASAAVASQELGRRCHTSPSSLASECHARTLQSHKRATVCDNPPLLAGIAVDTTASVDQHTSVHFKPATPAHVPLEPVRPRATSLPSSSRRNCMHARADKHSGSGRRHATQATTGRGGRRVDAPSSRRATTTRRASAGGTCPTPR